MANLLHNLQQGTNKTNAHVIIVDIEDFSDEEKQYISEKLVEICKGASSSYPASVVAQKLLVQFKKASDQNKKVSDKDQLIDEIIRTIRASVGNRAKESLIVDFIRNTNINAIKNRPEILEKFYTFAQKEQQKEMLKLIEEEGLNEKNAKRYIKTSLRREYASENGNELNETLPKMSPLNPAYHTKKQKVFEKISAFVEKFKGIGG